MRVLAMTLGLTALCASPLFAQIGNPAGNAPDMLMASPGQPMPTSAVPPAVASCANSRSW